ncbi:MAG: RNA polymerase sigma factor [Lachnospiraceae bacterium]
MEDSKIVDLYLDRDERAISETCDKYGRRIAAVAKNILGDEEDAKECENDTYLKAWNSIPPHEPRAYFFAFLARIARHIAIDLCRGKSRAKRYALIVELSDEMEECIPSPDDTECRVEEHILGEAISTFLWGIKEDERYMFIRRYWYVDSIAKLASELDAGHSKVKTGLYRTRQALKEYLIKEGYDL